MKVAESTFECDLSRYKKFESRFKAHRRMSWVEVEKALRESFMDAILDTMELSVVPVGWIRSEWGFYLTLRAAKCEDVERRGVLRSAAAAVMQGVSE